MAPTSIFFNGRLITTPGAYTEIDASGLEVVGLSASGIVAAIGESVGGTPWNAIDVSEVRNELDIATNPPVLHRKELFVDPEYPGREKFAKLTGKEEGAGLLDDPSGIGTRDGWDSRLRDRGYRILGHRLVASTQ